MKKIFRRIFGSIFVIFMLFSVAFIGHGKNTKTGEEVASSYEYEGNTKIMTDLISSTEVLATQYNLADFYPMINENQTDSKFCWIYSSMKSLESALMVQKNEFYNFSEIGLAYLYYADRISKTGAGVAYNVSGNFYSFVECYQDYGLVLESDFSNSNYKYINSRTYADYSFVQDYSTKELNSQFKPYLIGTNESFSRLATSRAKTVVLKRFIKNYGGVFAGIVGGDSKGCLYTDNSALNVTRGLYKFYDDDRTYHQNSTDYYNLGENHAVTIIGWNDDIVFGQGVQEQGAFIAMNSWGFENNSYELFYIPYSYTDMLSTCNGFVCNGEKGEISIESSSDSSMTDDILTGSNELKNFYAYDDEIWINYKLNISSFADLSVKISRGSSQLNEVFGITSNTETKTVKISLNNSADFYGGYYTVSFFNGETLIGKRGIFIYSGTEINYFKLRSNAMTGEVGLFSVDGHVFDNAFLAAENSATIMVPSSRLSGGDTTLFLEFNRSPINNLTFIELSNKHTDIKPFNMEIAEIEVVSSNDSSLENKYTSEQLASWLFFKNTINEDGNSFLLQIGYGVNVAEFNDCLIKFKIKLSSIIYDCEREFNFNMFVSDRYHADNSDLNTIFYELDGGDNNEKNITKYPRYVQNVAGDSVYDPNMTSIELLNPTKPGFVFIGWYLNENFTPDSLIAQIDSSLTGNITLYAKWESLNYNYFTPSLTLTNVFDYKGNAKDLSETLVYGDSIRIRFSFVAGEMQSQSIQYFFYGTELVEDYLVGNYKDFDLNFPKLESGLHVFVVKVKALYGSYEVVKQASISVSVNKRPVVFGFDSLKLVYNGTIQKPTVVMQAGFEFYEEDYEGKAIDTLFKLVCQKESKNVGSYNFYVSELNNKNYSFDASSNTSKCVLEIIPKPISLYWKEYNQVYDGKNHFPEYEVNGIVPGDSITFRFTVDECKNAGDYIVNIVPSSISNSNYSVSEVEDFAFTIEKAKIKVILHNTTDRIQTEYWQRATPKYTVLGGYFAGDELNIIISTEAKSISATKSGDYLITCSASNPNYECETLPATYTLTGYYNVYYQLEDGTSYTERVEEGQTPVGVTKQQLGVSRFSKIDYSEDYIITGDDIYVQVTYKDYTAFVYIAIVCSVAALIGFIVYLKKRGSSVR